VNKQQRFFFFLQTVALRFEHRQDTTDFMIDLLRIPDEAIPDDFLSAGAEFLGYWTSKRTQHPRPLPSWLEGHTPVGLPLNEEPKT
jgi:hypothetical protein